MHGIRAMYAAASIYNILLLQCLVRDKRSDGSRYPHIVLSIKLFQNSLFDSDVHLVNYRVNSAKRDYFVQLDELY